MSGRSVTGLPFYVFAPLCALSFAAACSSDATDYFGTPIPAAGKGGTGTGGASAAGGTDSETGGTGGSIAGTGSGVGGSGGGMPGKGGTDAMGGSANPGGGSPTNGGTGGDVPSKGGAGSGGTANDAGVSGEGGAGQTGNGGTGGTGGTQQTGGEAGMQGGQAGEPGGGGGTGGTSPGGTGGTGGQPATCGADHDCAPAEYCKKSSCDAATGVCTKRAMSCTGNDAALNPVCGCDHMTYYTACVAAHEGVNVASSGACSTGAATCNRTDGGASCSPTRARAACYRTRSTNSCNTGSPPNDGVCWVLPETCPTEPKTEQDCNNGDTPICRGLCEALEKNRPLIRNASQCQP